MEGVEKLLHAHKQSTHFSAPYLETHKTSVTCICAHFVYRIWSKWEDKVLVCIYFWPF